MRAFVALLMLSPMAAAETPAPAASLGPSKVVEVQPWTPPARAAQKYPGVTGKDALGVVIDPEHGDGQRWPYGIWIEPPATRDDMALVPGSMDLPASAALSARIARGFEDSVGAVLDLLMTPRFVRQL